MANVLLWYFLQESEAQDVPDEVLSPAEFSASDIAPVDDSDIDFPVNYEVTIHFHIWYIIWNLNF